METEFYRVNINTGEYTEKVVLDIEDEDNAAEGTKEMEPG